MPREGREQAVFFLTLAKDALRSLGGRCAVTRQPVDLQIYADHATLTRIRFNLVRFQCPHCGEEHETMLEAAWPEPTWIDPQRANRARDQHATRDNMRSR